MSPTLDARTKSAFDIFISAPVTASAAPLVALNSIVREVGSGGVWRGIGMATSG